MNILILSSFDIIGGAARAANRLNRSLNQNKKYLITSRMKVARKLDDRKSILCPNPRTSCIYNQLKSRLSLTFNRLQLTDNKIHHSCSFIPTNIEKSINKSNADIVNLHWVQSEFISIESIGRIKKPIIWTLHDAWPFCGSEHYPKDINDLRYINGYKKNNRNHNHSGLDLDKWSWERKKKSWKTNFNIISPSKWLGNMARNSYLMKDANISIIPNPLPTNIYKPINKEFARSLFELPQNKPLILFGAFSGIENILKGWGEMNKCIHILQETLPDLEVIVLGQSEPISERDKNGIYHFIPKLTDDVSLSIIYSAANVVVVPSKVENLCQMATEAQSCGVPVVTFNTTGMAETVVDKETGYLAEAFKAEDLAKGIEWIIINKDVENKLSIKARQRASELWNYETISNKYFEVYHSLLENKYISK